MICLSRSDLNIERSDKSKGTRTNYNKLIPVNNGKINCYDDGEYDLTDLCYDYDYEYDLSKSWNSPGQLCTLASGKRIELNPE